VNEQASTFVEVEDVSMSEDSDLEDNGDQGQQTVPVPLTEADGTITHKAAIIVLASVYIAAMERLNDPQVPANEKSGPAFTDWFASDIAREVRQVLSFLLMKSFPSLSYSVHPSVDLPFPTRYG
jgi:hypothetical protein